MGRWRENTASYNTSVSFFAKSSTWPATDICNIEENIPSHQDGSRQNSEIQRVFLENAAQRMGINEVTIESYCICCLLSLLAVRLVLCIAE